MRTRLPDLADELGTTDRTLRRAVAQGLLRAHRPSARVVDLPLAERAYVRRAWPLLNSLRQALRTEPGVSLAVLFGSRARGDEQLSSDIDLLLLLRGGADARQLSDRLSERVGLRVQGVLLEDAYRAPLLLAEVIKEGRVLVDRGGNWARLLEQREQVERAARRARRRIDRELAAAFGSSDAA